MMLTSIDEVEVRENFRNLEDASDDVWAYPAITWVENHALITYFNYKGELSLKLKSLPHGMVLLIKVIKE